MSFNHFSVIGLMNNGQKHVDILLNMMGEDTETIMHLPHRRACQELIDALEKVMNQTFPIRRLGDTEDFILEQLVVFGKLHPEGWFNLAPYTDVSINPIAVHFVTPAIDNLFKAGYIENLPNTHGWRITPAGREYLVYGVRE